VFRSTLSLTQTCLPIPIRTLQFYLYSPSFLFYLAQNSERRAWEEEFATIDDRGHQCHFTNRDSGGRSQPQDQFYIYPPIPLRSSQQQPQQQIRRTPKSNNCIIKSGALNGNTFSLPPPTVRGFLQSKNTFFYANKVDHTIFVFIFLIHHSSSIRRMYGLFVL